jgi:transposase-like protein
MKKEKLKTGPNNRSYFSEAFKRRIIEEYLKTGEAKEQIQMRHGIKGNSSIQKWMKILGYSDGYQKGINLEVTIDNTLAKQPISKSPETLQLEAKIRLLERQLDDERLRSEMYNRMIDLAEKTYKITVRKNSNTK